MIDWHSHILPDMDDGSHCVAESISLLEMLADQGAETVVATPHFYANDESVKEFLNRREKSFDTLKEKLTEKSPEILLGAEVRYYPGISKLSELPSLCIENTDLLILEMPTGKWTEYALRELVEISSSGSIKIVLAHIERYLKKQTTDAWNRLYESGILMQSNASFFTSFSTKRKALKLLENGGIHFVGSDCHDIKTRPPQIGKAFDVIRKEFGTDFILQMNKYGETVLSKK